MDEIITKFSETLLAIDRLGAKEIVEDLSRDYAPIKLIEEIIVPSLELIGKGWQDGTYALSQVYMAGRICEEIVDGLLPPGDPNRKDQPKMAICVLNDHHQLGKIIVYSVLRASGFEVMDYGVKDVNDLVERVQKDKIEILLISVLMLPSALKIRQVKEKIDGMDHNVKLIVGGAPFRFDDKLWKTVGADAMCSAASEAVPTLEQVMGGDI